MLQNTEKSERGVSPVIGVILMVAITVILAAVIAAFVLDIGPSDTDPIAAVEIDGDNTTEVSVTLQSVSQGDGIAVFPNDEDINKGDELDSIEIGGDDGDDFIASTATTGSSITLDGSDEGNVNGELDGEYNFIAISYDGEDPEDLANEIDGEIDEDSTEILAELEDDPSVDIAVEEEFEVEIED